MTKVTVLGLEWLEVEHEINEVDGNVFITMKLEDFTDQVDSTFGDGVYDGLKHAKELELVDDDLIDYTESDLLRISEHMEADRANSSRAKWCDKVPTEAGQYWWWSGEPTEHAQILSVWESSYNTLVTKPEFRCVITCAKLGGFWQSLIPPKTDKHPNQGK